MEFIYLQTTNLVDLVGRNEEDRIDWSVIGTDAKTINASQYTYNKRGNVVIPVNDTTLANTFVSSCISEGVHAEMLSESQVVTLVESLKMPVYRVTNESLMKSNIDQLVSSGELDLSTFDTSWDTQRELQELYDVYSVSGIERLLN